MTARLDADVNKALAFLIDHQDRWLPGDEGRLRPVDGALRLAPLAVSQVRS